MPLNLPLKNLSHNLTSPSAVILLMSTRLRCPQTGRRQKGFTPSETSLYLTCHSSLRSLWRSQAHKFHKVGMSATRSTTMSTTIAVLSASSIFYACNRTPPEPSSRTALNARHELISDFQTGFSRTFYALLINGDNSVRHIHNIASARAALGRRGFRRENIYVSSFANNTATLNAIQQTLIGIRNRLSADDLFLIYVTGHGINGALVLQNEQIISHRNFVELFFDFRQNHLMFVLDGCFSGAVPPMIRDYHFNAVALSPVDGNTESICGCFAPVFWPSLAFNLMDTDRNGTTSLREAFNYTMWQYNQCLTNSVGSGDSVDTTLQSQGVYVTSP